MLIDKFPDEVLPKTLLVLGRKFTLNVTFC
jgi:hypothetical protein